MQAVYADPCDDCAQLQTGTLRVVRGGNFGEVQTSSRTAYRTGGAQEFGFAAIGFRCARAP